MILTKSKNLSPLPHNPPPCPIGKNLCFQPDFVIFFARFFANSENTSKFKETSEFRQEMLNILSALKFVGSHLEFYE